MPPRIWRRTNTKVAKPSKIIRLPIELERYREIIADRKAFRNMVDGMIERYPGLFPGSITKGYVLHAMRTSVKMPEIQIRRIKLKERDGQGEEMIFTIVPSSIMPSLTGYTDEVEKAIFLHRFGVPFWALSYVFGRDDEYGYRMVSHLGRYSIVQTTVQDADRLPEHLSHNFWPYGPRAKICKDFLSPVHKLNGFVYNDNWLHNLLISTSILGVS